jgi:hypothetical protein
MRRWSVRGLGGRLRGSGTGNGQFTRKSPMSSPNIFGSNQNPAVPGGSVAKPLIIALLALVASRYFSGKAANGPALRRQSRNHARRRPRRHQSPTLAISLMGSAASSSSSSRRVLATRSTPGSIPAPTKTSLRIRFPMRLVATSSTSFRVVPDCHGTRWSRSSRVCFRERSTSSPLRGGCRPSARWRGF